MPERCWYRQHLATHDVSGAVGTLQKRWHVAGPPFCSEIMLWPKRRRMLPSIVHFNCCSGPSLCFLLLLLFCHDGEEYIERGTSKHTHTHALVKNRDIPHHAQRMHFEVHSFPLFRGTPVSLLLFQEAPPLCFVCFCTSGHVRASFVVWTRTPGWRNDLGLTYFHYTSNNNKNRPPLPVP